MENVGFVREHRELSYGGKVDSVWGFRYYSLFCEFDMETVIAVFYAPAAVPPQTWAVKYTGGPSCLTASLMGDWRIDFQEAYAKGGWKAMGRLVWENEALQVKNYRAH